MKRIALSVFLLVGLIVNSQEDQKQLNDKNYNEIKLNGLMLLAGAIEVTYERTLNEESSFGISSLVAFDKDNLGIEYYVSPFYRHYFGKKYAAGFFVEGFGMLNSSERRTFIFGTGEYQTDFALGIGFGGKWVSRRGFVAELSLGYGRNLFNADESEFELVAKGGITIGYRF